MGTPTSYVVRAAGSASRLGKAWKTYPCDLRSLVLALDEAQFRSLYHGPHVLTVVEGQRNRVIRLYEHGHLVWAPTPPATSAH